MNLLIDLLNRWSDSVTAFAVPILLQSGLLIVVLLLLDLALRNKARAALRYGLLLLILVKLVLPPGFASPTGIGYWLGLRREQPPRLSPTAVATVRFIETPASALGMYETFTGVQTAPKLRPVTWLLLGWSFIAVGLFGCMFHRSRRVKRTVADAQPAPEALAQMLDACRQQLKIRTKVRLAISEQAASPAVCGLFQPLILIPRQLSERLTTPQLRAVLLHELAHLKRGDVWINYAQTLLQIIYWWHPLLWLANARIRRVREEAVDEAVMVALGSEAGIYPSALLKVARLAFARPFLSLGLIGIIEPKSALSARIRRLLDRPTPKSAKLDWTGLAAVAISGALLLPMTHGQRHGSDRPVENKTVSADSTKAVTISIKFVALPESGLEKLTLGIPSSDGTNGHRAWILSTEQFTNLLATAKGLPEADVLSGLVISTISGEQGQVFVGQTIAVAGKSVPIGPICDVLPRVQGTNIELTVHASLTEEIKILPPEAGVSSVNSYIEHDVGDVNVTVSDNGGIVLQNSQVKTANGKRILVIISPRLSTTPDGTDTQTDAGPLQSQPKQPPTEGRPDASANDPDELKVAKDELDRLLERYKEKHPKVQEQRQKIAELEAARAAGGRSQSRSDPVSAAVTVTVAGRLYLGDRPVTEEELKQALADAVAKDPKTGLTIRADTRAPFEQIVKVIDASKQANIKSISAFTGAQPTNSSNVQRAGAVAKDDNKRANDGLASTHSSATNKVPLLGDLPFLGRLFRSKSKSNEVQREKIRIKLNEIILPEVRFDNTPLLEAFRQLSEQAVKHDPEGQGVNFLFNPNVIGATPQTTGDAITIDPITGKSATLPAPEPLDINTVIVHINPPLRNVRLADALEAIVKVADKPIRYSIADYAVVFSQKPPETRQLETRVFRVIPHLFLENLQKQMPSYDTTNIAMLVRGFLEGIGVSVLPPNQVYYGDRKGMLMVRATAQELDLVQKALEVLIYFPPQTQITIEAKFVEVSQEDARKLGFDSLFSDGPTIGHREPRATVSNHPEKTIAVLTVHQTKVVFRALDQRAGVDILSAPKVTTLSGRQARIFATPTTVLEILPLVAEDGITLSVDASATVTGILADRRVRTRKLQGNASVYDGQTLVLGNTAATVIARESNGQSVTNAIPEDSGKRLLAFITPTIIDPAGNPVHAPGQEPFDANVIPPQPPR